MISRAQKILNLHVFKETNRHIVMYIITVYDYSHAIFNDYSNILNIFKFFLIIRGVNRLYFSSITTCLYITALSNSNCINERISFYASADELELTLQISSHIAACGRSCGRRAANAFSRLE